MGPVRRATTRVAAWLAVTAAAVALSWYAVRTVLRDTVFEPPRAPALAAEAVDGPAPDPSSFTPAGDATISATSRPAPVPAPTTKAPSPPGAPSSPPPSAPGSPVPAEGSAAAPGTASGQVRSFEVRGGRASFTFGPDSASFIAAAPNSGWAVKVWPGDRWVRVDFTRGDRTSSIFVTWNDHAPIAETYEA